MSLPTPISKYVLKILVYDLTTIHNNGRSLIDMNRENSVTKLSPVGRRTQPVIPINTHTISLPCFHFSFHHFIMRVIIIITYCE